MGLRIERTPQRDLTPAGWAEHLPAGFHAVRSWLPDTFESYARVLHPVSASGRNVRWRELSAWSGQPLEPTSTFETMERRADGARWSRASFHNVPMSGDLGDDFDPLLDVLSPATSTALVWSLGSYTRGAPFLLPPKGLVGRAVRAVELIRDRAARVQVELAPEVHLNGRQLYLYRGVLDPDTDTKDWRPLCWWPDDFAWLVSTDIDALCTYVGGSRRLIDDLLASRELEVLPARLDDPYDPAG